jgi:prevent-host-death family protein
MAAKKQSRVRETVSLYDAKTRLSALIEQVAQGGEVMITKSGKPKALLVPLEDTLPLRVPGRGKGKWHVGANFDAPLPAEVLADFGAPERE